MPTSGEGQQKREWKKQWGLLCSHGTLAPLGREDPPSKFQAPLGTRHWYCCCQHFCYHILRAWAHKKRSKNTWESPILSEHQGTPFSLAPWHRGFLLQCTLPMSLPSVGLRLHWVQDWKTKQNKKNSHLAQVWRFGNLLFIPNAPVRVYFSESSSSYAMHLASFYSCSE